MEFIAHLKVIVKAFIPPIVLSLLHPNTLLPRKLSIFQGKDRIDEKMLGYLNYENGYFIEIGAGDGVYLSNTYYFEKYRNWGGLLVDPVLHHYINIIQERPKSRVFLAAATSFENENPYVELFYAGYLSTATSGSSDLPNPEEHILDAKNYIPESSVGVKFVSVSRTLTSMLDEALAPKFIDFFSLDVEGAELEVLKGLNFEKYHIKYILVESRSLSSVKKYLELNSYSLVNQFGSCDYLFELSEPSFIQL
jgi:hypothetical protein